MIGIGTLVNALGVILGSSIGLLFHRKLPERQSVIVFQAIGLFTMVLGISMALKTENMMIMVFSLVIGAILGQALAIDKGIDKFADLLKMRLNFGNDKFSQGLVTAFLLFCIGSMTILGAIEEGLGNPPTLLYTKTILDTFAAIAFSSAFGIGVIFSALPLLIFQGGITLLASIFGEFMSSAMITELTAVGGILLLGLSFNILQIKEIKVVNMLPGLIIVIILKVFF